LSACKTKKYLYVTYVYLTYYNPVSVRGTEITVVEKYVLRPTRSIRWSRDSMNNFSNFYTSTISWETQAERSPLPKPNSNYELDDVK